MAAPQRLQLVGALAAIGPASIAELARHVGRAADSLYRHVRQLERHRLVRRAGRAVQPDAAGFGPNQVRAGRGRFRDAAGLAGPRGA